jgi:hypothetical protein
MIKPRDIFDKLIGMAIILDRGRFPGIGGLLSKLSKNDREILSDLKSDDVKNDRMPWK